MALEINAWYVKFVQFAQQQDDAVNSKVIARVSGEDRIPESVKDAMLMKDA